MGWEDCNIKQHIVPSSPKENLHSDLVAELSNFLSVYFMYFLQTTQRFTNYSNK